MPPILEVHNLIKHFPGVRAVEGVSFAIQPGTCFGLLGPNGAGKTTTVEALEGIQPAPAGQVRYKGGPLDRRVRHEVGIMFQSTALQEYLSVAETLELFGRLYPRTLPQEELVRRCSLEGLLERDTRKLSGGQRQRLLLAIALVNDPEVLFLDEPTTGLDPQARRYFWNLVGDIKAQGKTVVLTTHYMEEAYVLCDEIAIMDQGRIIAQGAPKTLLAEHFNDVVLELPREDLPAGFDPGDLELLECGETVEILARDVNATVRRLLEAEASLNRLRIRPRTLDDLFLELTGRGLRA